VDRTIKESATECQLDPEKLKAEIKMFLNKKLNLGSIFDEKDRDRRKTNNEEKECGCQISCKTTNFLLSIQNK